MRRRSHRTAGTGSARRYPRTARLNQLVQEIVAEELERIDDPRLGLLTVVAVEVETDLRHATVWYSALGADDGVVGAGDGAEDGKVTPAGKDPVVVALAEHRPRLQAAIGRQARLKRTPELTFRPDTVIPTANRVEEILRDLAVDGDEGDEATTAGPATGAPSGVAPGPAEVAAAAETADTER